MYFEYISRLYKYSLYNGRCCAAVVAAVAVVVVVVVVVAFDRHRVGNCWLLTCEDMLPAK